MVRRSPNRCVMTFAPAVTAPLSSISFPNTAPSRKIGKNWARKSAALRMKVWVQFASSGCPPKAAAISAQSGASSSTLQPRNASQTSTPSPAGTPRSPIASALRQQDVEIGRRTLAEIGRVHFEEFARRGPPLVAQLGDERPFGVELGRGTEGRQHVALDPVGLHVRPACALAGAGIGDLTQQRDH